MCRRWMSPLVRCLLVFDPYGSSHRILFSGLEKALPQIQLLRQQPDILLGWQGVDRTTPNAHSTTVNNFPSSLFCRAGRLPCSEEVKFRINKCLSHYYPRRSFVNCYLKSIVTNLDNLPFSSLCDERYISSRSLSDARLCATWPWLMTWKIPFQILDLDSLSSGKSIIERFCFKGPHCVTLVHPIMREFN
jgi:hypothetical protein